ncbi:hypothetical protein KK090_02430 [Curtobacterium flaccumfaciens pv. poinsettiae]|uniref:Swt1 family HEPN domain-containing protein n=1 Tax=Curtobacterium poinsettiae TaxID=159612 RepID=UPI001BE0A3C0|nr:Swt1 family HEPN domain-containing protein [Curtobacterium flaccumfaciens]MBT1618105.1 hypothetical protein [Curtobacterium flaccumfaciens pv. poinsettiae]
MDPADEVSVPSVLHGAAGDAIVAAHALGTPQQSIAMYARWWQLESWVRDLIYMELRAAFGIEWTDAVRRAQRREERDASFSHMTGVDNDNPLAYLDYSQLVRIIHDDWNLFAPSLFERTAWEGRQAELLQIRHRIGHIRRPNRDDLSRIEQTLRDLETGAFIAMSDYNTRWRPPADGSDAVTDGWIRRNHSIALRLLDHAQRRYDTELQISFSARPWAVAPFVYGPGILCHVSFNTGGRFIDVAGLWRELHAQDLVKYVVAIDVDYATSVSVTFSGADDGTAVSDAIGRTFETVLQVSNVRNSPDEWSRLEELYKHLDFRVHVNTGWNIVASDTLPMSNFMAGATVHLPPNRF